MVTMDSKGRIVLPQDLRERLGLSPGSEVEVREEEGRVVVEPEADPERIIDDLESLIERASAHRVPREPNEMDIISKDHLDSIRRGAGRAENDGENRR